MSKKRHPQDIYLEFLFVDTDGDSVFAIRMQREPYCPGETLGEARFKIGDGVIEPEWSAAVVQEEEIRPSNIKLESEEEK